MHCDTKCTYNSKKECTCHSFLPPFTNNCPQYTMPLNRITLDDLQNTVKTLKLENDFQLSAIHEKDTTITQLEKEILNLQEKIEQITHKPINSHDNLEV